MRAVYFIEKEGVYSHGVFWIGTDLEEGKRHLRSLALRDRDSYHTWSLLQYVDHTQDHDPDDDPREHIEIAFTRKNLEEAKENNDG